MNRRDDLLNLIAFTVEKYRPYRNLPQSPWGSVYLELPKLELELQGRSTPPLVEAHFEQAIRHLRERKDCSDFGLAVLLRILYRYPQSRLLRPGLRQQIEEAVIGAMYWLDEPGNETMCFSTENHQIIYHANELLAGQLFPETIFSNNQQSGAWHRTMAENRIRQWLAWRVRFGYSEWNSNWYYDEDLLGLLNLVDFAEDETIRDQSEQLSHLTFFHIAVNSFQGVFGSTHGRAYARGMLNPQREPTQALAYLGWGLGNIQDNFSLAAVVMAASRYQVPDIIQAIALDTPAELENRERHSLNVEDAAGYGVEPDNPEHINFFLSAHVWSHRQVVEMVLATCPEKHYIHPWAKADYDTFMAYEKQGQDYDPDPSHMAMTQVDTYTFRTPDYMLSCAQDYRAGKPGFQQHIWQATLADQAVVYVTHPGAADIGTSRPDYWAGNGIMPRAAAYRNLLIALYQFDPAQVEYAYTHAFFPQYAFDEWTIHGNWIFGRKAQGYIALYSHQPVNWAEPRPDVNVILDFTAEDGQTDLKIAPYELIAPGSQNIWICELGNPSTHGTFADFLLAISGAEVNSDEMQLQYQSPSLGQVSFGWDRPFKVAGRTIRLKNYPRFENPYCQADFNKTLYHLKHEDQNLTLDFTPLEKQP